MWNFHKNKEVEPVQAIQMNIYQNKTYVLEMSLYRERQNFSRRNFMQWIKAPIFLEAVLVLETM